MSPVNLVFAAYALLKSTSTSPKVLALETVQSWIRTNGNRDNYGRGYGGSRRSAMATNGFVDVVQQSTPNGGFRVTATVFFDPRQGASAEQSWDAAKLDSALQKFFGRNLRMRIRI